METLKIMPLFLFSSTILISCSKDNSNDIQSTDCVDKNYGVVEIVFSDLIEKHGILTTEVGTSNGRNKIVNAAVLSDAIRLKP